MSATKHTKGEWKKVRKVYGWDIESDGVWIGSIHNDHSSENERPPQGFPGNVEGEANADLVISASTLQSRIDGLEAASVRWSDALIASDNRIDRLEAEKAELVESNIKFKSVLIHCYQYMTGTKPGPDITTITTELQKTMDDLGITGIGTTIASGNTKSASTKN